MFLLENWLSAFHVNPNKQYKKLEATWIYEIVSTANVPVAKKHGSLGE